MDLYRFFTAFRKLGKMEGSAEAAMFTTTMSLRYRFDTEALADDADDLREWAAGILDLARVAHVAGEFDLPSFLVVESIAAEFDTALTAVLESVIDDLLDDGDQFDDDDALDNADILRDWVFNDDWFDEPTDVDAEEAEMVSEEFFDIIDANFVDDSDCSCAACTAAADAATVEASETFPSEDLAPAVEAITAEAYRAASDQAQHPSMRTAVERYATEWHAAYDTARETGPYELAQFMVRLTELVDDTMFLLLAKGAPVDTFADRSRIVLGSVKQQLAHI
jgi:hypothetical protein